MPRKTIYFDYASATPVSDNVAKVMQPYFSQRFQNPSAIYGSAVKVRQQVEQARQRVAQTLGCRPGEVLFTAGGTEANNLAIRGVMEQFANSEMIFSAIEHESVIAPAKQYKSLSIPVDKQGIVKVSDVKKIINDSTSLVSVMMVNNEVGSIQPIKEIGAVISEVRKDRLKRGVTSPIYFHTDACQAGNYFNLNVARLKVDIMSLNGGKIYGPKQSGSLFVRAGVRVKPLIFGGGQEFGLRSGTENVPAIIGFSEALVSAQTQSSEQAKMAIALREKFILGLNEIFGSKIKINGPVKNRCPNNVNVTFFGQDNERLLFELDQRGIECATASACSASQETPSHVLRAIGLSDSEARSTLRFSFGRQNTFKEVEFCLEQIKQIITV